jgi:hypothetical protein
MGISINSARFLIEARRQGVHFGETLTLGRQEVIVSPQRLESLMRKNDLWPPAQGEAGFREAMTGTTWRFEPLARALGAGNVSSCDFSGYEKATLIHDLNVPIGPEWHERFDVVIDGGTLEHVFNFPVAIANCMNLVKTGGHLLLFSPSNNMCGHGFYQFSPELFFRVLAKENGFEVKRMVMFEEAEYLSSVLGIAYPFAVGGPWYSVTDPAQIGKRVPLLNSKATQICILARKVSREQIFARTPQQSDYVPQWKSVQDGPPKPLFFESKNPLVVWLRKTFPESVCRELLPKFAVLVDPLRMWKTRRKNSFSNPEYYQRVRD